MSFKEQMFEKPLKKREKGLCPAFICCMIGKDKDVGGNAFCLRQRMIERKMAMDCQETQRLVMPYIQDELTPEELEAFLEHVEKCPDCQEELEICFTVALGLRQLDEGSGSYNIKGEMEASLEESRRQVRLRRLLKISCYAVNTLWGLGLLTTFLLQLRIWMIG